MSWVLKENNVEVIKTLNWNPRTFGKITNTSYPDEVAQDYVWENEEYWLGWLDDPLPQEPEPYVPSVVTMVQARLALYNHNLLDLVDESISLMPIKEQREKALIEWEFSTNVRRDSFLVYGLAGALGLTDEMLNSLFIEASNL